MTGLLFCSLNLAHRPIFRADYKYELVYSVLSFFCGTITLSALENLWSFARFSKPMNSRYVNLNKTHN
jgi:hypothetical protein